MNEKQLIEICKEFINTSSWYESDLFENGEFENYLNEKLNTDTIKYYFDGVNETEWEDDGRGKYYSQYITYQLIKYDSKIKGYPTKESIVEELNIYFDLPVTRSGSYFSEWLYEYEKPTIMQKKIIHVPEQIIPAHDEEKMEEI